MAVLNVTPDSFSDGGLFDDPERAIHHAEALIAAGADVIDVGGESTRPGATEVTVAEELARVEPVLERLVPLANAAGVRVSIDTRHVAVAEAAARSGVDYLNDVSGSLGELAADLGLAWICMHMAGSPETFANPPSYDDVVAEVVADLTARAAAVAAAGVREVWIDPGIGFGKSPADNVKLLGGLGAFVATGYPVLIGTSRKSTLGLLTAASDASVRAPADTQPHLTPVHDRVEASIATATWSLAQGVAMIRVHDVAEHVQARTVVSGPPPAALAA
jgi:dihydropteroate synthase